MRKVLGVIGKILGWVFTILCVLALVFAIFSFMNTKKTGEPTTILGYRPVYVLTGSMEPTMMTDGIVITKKVNGMNDIKVGDIVTYHVDDENGKTLVVTHRITKIDENGEITTKGDNNRVSDAIPITIDNIEAKVVLVFNWVADIIHTWATTKGKILICSIAIGIVLMIYALATIFGSEEEPQKEPEKKDGGEEGSSIPEDKQAPPPVGK